MADNFLERRQQDYEKRKAEWLKSKHRLPIKPRESRQRGEAEDEE